MITQEQLIHDFAEQNTPQINKELFVRSEDAAIRELQNVILSCQRNKFFTIKVVKFRVVEDYLEMMKHLFTKIRVQEKEKINMIISILKILILNS